MQTKTTSWCYEIVEGVQAQHSVSTERNPGESAAAWSERHREAVDADKAVFKPVECN